MYTAAIADAIVRYKRLKFPETDIRFTTGTDEHGIKIQQAAASHKVPVDLYCDNISQSYEELFNLAGIGCTDFIRTTEERHKNSVQHFWVRFSFIALYKYYTYMFRQNSKLEGIYIPLLIKDGIVFLMKRSLLII